MPAPLTTGSLAETLAHEAMAMSRDWDAMADAALDFETDSYAVARDRLYRRLPSRRPARETGHG